MENMDPENSAGAKSPGVDNVDDAARERRATRWSIAIGIGLVAIILAVVSAFTCSGGTGVPESKTASVSPAQAVIDGVPVVATVDEAVKQGKFAFVIFQDANEEKNMEAINATEEAIATIQGIGGQAAMFRLDGSRDFYNKEIEKSGVKEFPAVVAAKDTCCKVTVEGELSTDKILNAYIEVIHSSMEESASGGDDCC